MRNWMTMFLDIIFFGLWSKRKVEETPSRHAKRKPPEGLLPRIPGPPVADPAEKSILEQVFYPMGRYGIASAYFNSFCIPDSEPPLRTVGGGRNPEWYRWYAANNKSCPILEIIKAHERALIEQEAAIEEYLTGEL